MKNILFTIMIVLFGTATAFANPNRYGKRFDIGDGLSTSGGDMSGDINLKGNKLTLDLDMDTYIYSDADDSVLFYSSSGKIFSYDSNSLDINADLVWGAYLTVRTGIDDGIKFAIDPYDGGGNFNLIFTAYANRTADHNHSTVSTDPTIWIHSATAPGTDDTQWVNFYHDKTDANIATGKGDIKLDPAGNDVVIVNTKGATNSINMLTESVTFDPNPGNASKATVGTILPDGAFVVGVSSRVTTQGTNCAGYRIGVSGGGDDDQFGEDLAVTAGSTSDNSDFTAVLANPVLTDSELVVTGTNGAGVAADCFDLVVALTVHYIGVSAATSN